MSLLTPLYKTAFKIILQRSYFINVKIIGKHAITDKANAIAVTTIQIYSTDQRFKSITAHVTIMRS